MIKKPRKKDECRDTSVMLWLIKVGLISDQRTLRRNLMAWKSLSEFER